MRTFVISVLLSSFLTLSHLSYTQAASMEAVSSSDIKDAFDRLWNSLRCAGLFQACRESAKSHYNACIDDAAKQVSDCLTARDGRRNPLHTPQTCFNFGEELRAACENAKSSDLIDCDIDFAACLAHQI